MGTSLMTNSELRKQARKILDGNWTKSAIATFIVLWISCGVSIYITYQPNSFLGNFSQDEITFVPSIWSIICMPLQWGFCMYFLSLVRQQKVSLGSLFSGYSDCLRILGTQLLVSIYIFLWALLLIIPGLIKAYSYALTPFILRDHPELAYNSAINESMRLMNGHKAKLFFLHISFLGWSLLCTLTFGLGFLWLLPYIETTMATFYENLVSESRSSESDS